MAGYRAEWVGGVSNTLRSAGMHLHTADIVRESRRAQCAADQQTVVVCPRWAVVIVEEQARPPTCGHKLLQGAWTDD